MTPDLAAAARALVAKIARQSWRALELTKLALRSQRPATTTFDITAQALLFGSQDKHDRMTAFLWRTSRYDHAPVLPQQSHSRPPLKGATG